ncbi:MAG TPA: CFI-box-CTERM domain-containing protein [Lachnospiraceae bacterium]|nr:CFI-box-CTERM domain-containing protein [Lachnospiraceae bacterium]
MEYREMQCPHCNGQLQVPDHLKEYICMYCGKTVVPDTNETREKVKDNASYIVKSQNVRDLEKKLSLEWVNNGDYKGTALKILEEDKFNFVANCCLAFSNMVDILIPHLELMKSFKSNLYESAFQSYLEKCEPILQYLDRACCSVKNVNSYDTNINEFKCVSERELIMNCVNYFLDKLVSYIDQNKRTKSAKSLAYDECRYVLALYTVPMIEETRLEISVDFAEILVMQWGERFPKHRFSKASYEEIKDGFTRKKLCFITTAVCDSLAMPDNCYELEAFRAFRDNYLLSQEGGEALVKEYYEIAPILVSKINIHGDRQYIYKNLWNDYLKECLSYIEKNDFEHCKEQYISMVNSLKDTFGAPIIE